MRLHKNYSGARQSRYPRKWRSKQAAAAVYLVRMSPITSTGDRQLSVRAATITDIPLIRSLADTVWPQTYALILSTEQIDYMMRLMYSPEALEQQMQKGHQFIVLYNAEEPIGFASFNEQGRGIFKLQKIYVLPSQQGLGTGRQLLQFVIDMVLARGAKQLRLNVNRHNKARGFYERLGFAVLKEEKIDIGGGYVMDDYVMEKELLGNSGHSVAQ